MYKDTFLEEFYLDSLGQIRRSKDGYLNRFKKNDLAQFFVGTGGYFRIQVPKQRTTAIRSHLVLLLSGVTIPDDKEVDHIDGNKTNDLIENLRIVDRRLNNRNRKRRSDNTSGITGIRWSDYHQHYVVRRTIGDVRKSTSRKTLDEAILVLAEFSKQDSSYTPRHGK